MSDLLFTKLMIKFSLLKILRDKYQLIAEGLELGIVLFLLIGFYLAGILDSNTILKVTATVFLFNTLIRSSKVGSELITHRDSGFLQELNSAPLETRYKFIGLIAWQTIFTYIKILVAFIGLAALGVIPSLTQIFALIASVSFCIIFTTFICIYLTAKTNNFQLLTTITTIIAFLQFGLSGILVNSTELPIIALNPYTYIFDLFSYTMNNPNYPLVIDLFIITLCMSISYYLAKKGFEKAEI